MQNGILVNGHFIKQERINLLSCRYLNAKTYIFAGGTMEIFLGSLNHVR